MKLVNIPHKMSEKTKKYIQSARYYWNKVIRRITIDSRPIFIVGCGHSGTSLLLAILGTHSRIYAIPFESSIAIKDNQQRFYKALARFDKMAIVAGKPRWVEKTPKHIRHIRRILEWCPDAKILIILRDGRDVAFSIQARTGDLENGIKRWVEDNRAGKEFWGHPNVYVVKYEDLIGDFESTIKDILSFLGEEYEEKLRYYYKIKRKWYSDKIVKPPTPKGENQGQYRNWQINQPLFDGKGRWKKMPEQELSLINDVAGEMLTEFGYTRNDNPPTK